MRFGMISGKSRITRSQGRGKEEEWSMFMKGYDKEDREFVKCAGDIDRARGHLDYLIGKRCFFGIAFGVLAAVAVIMYIGATLVFEDPVNIEGLQLGARIPALLAVIALGMWTSTDACVKPLILFVHQQLDSAANKPSGGDVQ